MYKPTFTQSDLKSALQKLSGTPFVSIKPPPMPTLGTVVETAPIEPEIEEEERMAPLELVSPPEMVDKDRQIDVLKDIVQQLSDKVEEKAKPTSDLTLQRELKEAKEKQIQLEAEIGRQERTRALLVEQLKQSRDIQPLQKELDTLKSTIKELSDTIDKKETEIELYKEQLNTPKQVILAAEGPDAELQQELQAQKSRIIRFMSEKKELEAKLSNEAREKATLLARLHELAKRQENKEELVIRLKEVEAAKQSLEETLFSLQAEMAELKQTNEEATKQVALLTSNLQLAVEKRDAVSQELEKEVTAYTQELAVSRGCVIDRQQALEAEQKALRELAQKHEELKAEAHEIKTQKQLIEQHLARRVKECALLERKGEEEASRLQKLQDTMTSELQKSAQLEASIDQLKKNEEYIREELLQKSKSFEERLAKQHERHDALLSQNQAYLQELTYLRKMKERLQQLEELHVQFSQIVAAPILTPPIFSAMREE